MKTLESTYGHHFCEVDRGGMTLALPLATSRWPKSLMDGGRDRDRTCDPLDVNEVLSR
jgi:hypothetical protein